MYNFINSYQFHHLPSNQKELLELNEMYYKGLCVASTNPAEFCSSEPLTFTQATLYAPVVLLMFLYLPAFLYVCFLSYRFYGGSKFISGVIENPVYFIFPIVTNISFYELESENLKSKTFFTENEQMKELLKQSLMITPTAVIIDLKETGEVEEENDVGPTTEDWMDYASPISNSADEEIDVEICENPEISTELDLESSDEDDETQNGQHDFPHSFSLSQSNILYFLFNFGFIVCTLLDLTIQIIKRSASWGDISPMTKLAVFVLFTNIILWLDFVREILRKKAKTNVHKDDGWVYDLILFSTNGLVCIFLMPLFVLKHLLQR